MRGPSTIHTELNHFDEQELVTRVLNGDADAFNPTCAQISTENL